MTPAVLLLGGLEPSGRAGLLADVDTCRKFDIHPLAIATCLTAQGDSVFLSQPVATSTLRRQFDALAQTHTIAAMKSGAISDSRMLALLKKRKNSITRGLWVLDPLVRTSRGQVLSSLTRNDFLSLDGSDVVLTPNVPELAFLCGKPFPRHEDEAAQMAQSLLELGFSAVVVKGGHAQGKPVDIVCDASGVHFLKSGARLKKSPFHRGTGCRFASAVASGLALRKSLLDSVQMAREYVRSYLKRKASHE